MSRPAPSTTCQCGSDRSTSDILDQCLDAPPRVCVRCKAEFIPGPRMVRKALRLKRDPNTWPRICHLCLTKLLAY